MTFSFRGPFIYVRPYYSVTMSFMIFDIALVPASLFLEQLQGITLRTQQSLPHDNTRTTQAHP